uniref:Putative secreted protein n=1 Tax=Anopheles darlingi TaxID=43151 RepID=A0A2M4D0E4_ANODA
MFALLQHITRRLLRAIRRSGRCVFFGLVCFFCWSAVFCGPRGGRRWLVALLTSRVVPAAGCCRSCRWCSWLVGLLLVG